MGRRIDAGYVIVGLVWVWVLVWGCFAHRCFGWVGTLSGGGLVCFGLGWFWDAFSFRGVIG